MAGFAKVTVVGNCGGQEIVNVFHYRSEVWVPGVGSPFDDINSVIATFEVAVLTAWVAASWSGYVYKRTEAIGYNDALVAVPGAENAHEVESPGLLTGRECDGFGHTANIRWVCGEQHQITGVGHSRRNWGTTGFGPVTSTDITSDGHFAGTFVSTLVNNVANALSTSLLDVLGFATLIPIRLHHAKTLGIPSGITYSDIVGYKLPTKTGYRRSRLSEV